ncbi:unnamed protein product [Lactuca saligna]|uniref:Uncharacterized protein n=1 Tax=Lactuca saligna TaxID=75948 RepID=A0AA35YM83_LACSI|nr:unnamed protein product [Lactuca saligna]
MPDHGVQFPSEGVSRYRSAAVDAVLEEDIGGSTIRQRFRWKHNIDPLLAKSPIVIEIADGDDLQSIEMVGLHRLGEPGVLGTRSIPPSVSGDALSTYATTQVAPYLVAAVGHLCYVGSNLVDLVAVKSKHDELVEKVWLLKEERHKFDECYLMLSGEKTIVEAQVATLHGEFATEVSRRKVLEADLAWVLQKSVVRVVDRVVESSKFMIWNFYMKATCVATARSVDAMHVAIMDFYEMDFACYLFLGELILADLHQLCFEEEELVLDGGVDGVASTQPR